MRSTCWQAAGQTSAGITGYSRLILVRQQGCWGALCLMSADRPEAARALQRARGGIVILKGAGSLIAGPSGLVVCPYGNPGMASGGMGDILSGILGALVGQFNSLEQSAWLGVMAHALAGMKPLKQRASVAC